MPKKNKPTHEAIDSYLLCAETGKGKTYTARKILHDKLSHIPEDNRFLVCPTFDFDKTLGDYFTNEELVFEKMEKEFIPALLQLIQKDRDKIYDKWHYKYDKDGDKIKIKRERGTEPYQEYVLMLDDCIQYLGASKRAIDDLTLLFTKNRHYLLHIIVCQQYYKASHPCIRENARQILIWDCNLGELKKICDEKNQLKNNKDFMEYFRFITKPKHSYFHINNKKRGVKKYENPVSFKEFKLLRDNDMLEGEGESDNDDDD